MSPSRGARPHDVPSETKSASAPVVWAAWILTAALTAGYFLKNVPVPARFPELWKGPGFDPFNFQVLFMNLLQFAMALTAAGAACAAFLALGRSAARTAGWTWDPSREGSSALNGAFAFALGGGLYGFLFLGLGFCGLWNFRLLGGGVLLGTLVAVWMAFKARRRLPSLLPSWPREWPLKVMLILALFLPLLAILHGMTPEIFYDSQLYHLAIPQEWLARRGVVDLPGMVFSHFPYGGEMLFWCAYVLGGTAAAKIMSFVSWMAVCVLSAGFAGRLSGNKAASHLAFALTASCPLFCLTAWTTQVEGVLVLYGMAFIACLERASHPEDVSSRWWVASGFALASAMAVKYNGILLAVFLVPAILFSLKGREIRFRSAVFFLAAGAPVLGPWLLKNWVYARNPVYPYLSDFFGGRRMLPEGLKQLLQEQRLWQVTVPEDWLTLPWRMFTASPNGYNFLGPLVLSAPLWIAAAYLAAFMLRREKRGEAFPPLGQLLIGTALFFLVGLSLTHLPRFLAAGYPPLYVAAAGAVSGIPALRRMSAVFTSVVALLVLPVLLVTSLIHYSPQGVWTGREATARYAQRAGVTPYGFMVGLFKEKEEGPVKRVLLVGDARSLGYPGQRIAQSVFDEPFLVRIIRFSRNAGDVWMGLRKLGVDTVAINVEEALRTGNYGRYDLDKDGWTLLNESVRKALMPLSWADKGVLFKVSPMFGVGNPTAGAPNPFLYLAPQAALYAKAADGRDPDLRDKVLGELSELQPFTTQWLEERALWRLQDDRVEEALEDWKKASLRGPLQRGSYREWIQRLKMTGRIRESMRVGQEAAKWYPEGP